MRWVLYLVVVLFLLLAATFCVGYLLPAQTTISRSITLRAKPKAVFEVLADMQHMAEWNRNTEKVEMLPSFETWAITAGRSLARGPTIFRLTRAVPASF